MSLSKIDVAKNYSKALYETLAGENAVDEGKKDLDAIKVVFNADPDLAAALNSVALNSEQKESLLKPLIDGADSQYVKNLITMLVDYGHIGDFVAVIDEFNKIYNEKHGIVKATVVTAVPLDDRQKDDLAKSFSKRINANEVKLSTGIDPDIIGGVILKSSDVIFDGSIRTKIEQVKRLLLK